MPCVARIPLASKKCEGTGQMSLTVTQVCPMAACGTGDGALGSSLAEVPSRPQSTVRTRAAGSGVSDAPLYGNLDCSGFADPESVILRLEA